MDSPNFLGDPWDAIANHAPLVAATQEGLNKRDSPSVPSSMDLASSVPKYSRPNASRLFTFNVIGVIIFINSIESYNIIIIQPACLHLDFYSFFSVKKIKNRYQKQYRCLSREDKPVIL